MLKQALWMLAGVCALPALQAQEVKAKPPMYSYVANWELPRDQAKAMETQQGSNDAYMKKHVAEGNLIGFGSDVVLTHKPGEDTHDIWWSSMSMGGIVRVLEGLKSASEAPVLAAGKHNDKIYVSRYYNWRPGSFTNGYTRFSSYKLKAGAPADALDQMAKAMIVPMLEKLLASGVIYEYEIDQEAVHSGDPSTFSIVTIGNGPDSLDKSTAALQETLKSVAFSAATADSWMDSSAHRDGIASTKGMYK